MVDIEKKDTSETVKVIVRCRPMNKREKDLKSMKCVDLEEGTGRVAIMKEDETVDTGKPFTFDSVFDTESTQTAVYSATAEPLVEAVMEGYNGTVFAYGQTGCGKSFSMMGVPSDPTLMGIIPRAFQQIFDTIAANDVPDKKFLVQGCYIEIYNEEVRDLLSSNHTARLDLKEHPDKGVYIAGVSHHTVSGVDEITKLMEQGTANRSVGATLMNADSSRSHSIFIVQVESSQPSEAGEVVRQGVLNLVDLAGSERQGKTGATGQRLKEAAKINLSLSALGNVISALVAGKPHIPYRDSKLTRLLQNSLGGNSKTVMVAAVSPAQDNYEETLSTLRYANRAKQIKNKPKINEDPRDAMLREYQDEITRLRELLSQSGVAGAGAPGAGMDGVKATLIEQTRGALQKLDAEGAQGEAETRRQQQQLHMETAEQQAQLQALEAQRREVEAMRADLLRREQDLAQGNGVEDETVRMELESEKARLEEEMLMEREAQAALEQALREREEEGERIKRQLAHEQAERGRKQAELQAQLGELEHEHSAARRQLEAQLAKMEKRLMKGGARAQQDKADAIARLNKLRRDREHSEQERAALEQHARQLQQEVADTQEQHSAQAHELQELRRQVQLLQSELEDVRDEHAADQADSSKTVKELSKELWLYKTIVRSTVDPEAIRAAMAAARYDDRTGRWTLQQQQSGFVRPAPPSGPGAGSQGFRNKMYTRPNAPAGPAPLGLGRTRGLADTEFASPQPQEQRADNGWKKSIRGDFPPVSALTPTASAGATLGRPKTTRIAAPAPEVDMHELNNLPRRPGFRPNLADSDASHGSRSGSVTPRDPALDHMRPRQGFVPASQQPGSRVGSAKSAQADDLLATMQRRPGFSPAGM